MVNGILIKEIIRNNGGLIDIKESNNNSKVISQVQKAFNDPEKERFFDYLLENLNALKLLTNALVDLKNADDTAPIFFFSSSLKNDPEDGKKSREEFSKKCKYNLDPQFRKLPTIIQPLRQMDASKEFHSSIPPDKELFYSEQRKSMIFFLSDFYGCSLDSQINNGFLGRKKLLELTKISSSDYEKVISELLNIGVASVFQHICWCKGHPSAPYAILAHGVNETGDLKCPVCNNTLYTTRFTCFNPEFEPIIKSFGGFIPILIGWYLTNNSIKWTADITFDKKEYGDVIFKYRDTYNLVECKTWSRNKNIRGMKNCINEAVNQALSHVKFWKDNNVNIRRTDVITNEIETDEFNQELERALKSKEEEIGDNAIKIHPIKLILNFISSIIE